MSTADWAYVPAGSGPGHLQRVAGDLAFTKAQRTYIAFIDHTRDCATCSVDSQHCTKAEELWAAYQAAPST